jgi:hypothetical protein
VRPLLHTHFLSSCPLPLLPPSFTVSQTATTIHLTGTQRHSALHMLTSLTPPLSLTVTHTEIAVHYTSFDTLLRQTC